MAKGVIIMKPAAQKIETSAQEVANCFIEFASEIDENDLTNLKLQKLLYLAQGTSLAKRGRPLFNEPIEAWDFGPVVRSVYDNFKSCGSFPITAFDKRVKKSTLPEKEKRFLLGIWEKYGKYSANYLVDLTHKPNSPWKKTFVRGKNKEIAQKLMADYFLKTLS